MNTISLVRRSWLAPLALAAAASHALAQSPPYYSGPGWAEDMTVDGLPDRKIDDVLVGEFYPGVGGADLAVLTTGGDLYVSPGFAHYGYFELVGSNIVAISMLEGESANQLVSSDGTRLSRLEHPTSGPTWTYIDTAANPAGGTTLNSVETGVGAGVSVVLAIDAAGATLRVSKFNGTAMTQSALLTSTSLGQGTIYEAAGGNFTSDPTRPLQLAILTQSGLLVRELDGTSVTHNGYTYPDRSGSPAGAFIDVLPGSKMAVGRDTILWHYSYPGLGEIINLICDDHHEVQYVMGLGIQEAGFVDFVGGGSNDLLFAASYGDIIIPKNTEATSLGQALFALDLSQTAIVSLNEAPMSDKAIPTGHRAFVRSVDLDFDGAEELVIIDPRSWLCVIPKDGVTQPEKVHLINTGTLWNSGSDVYVDIKFSIPAGSGLTELKWRVYEWPDVGDHAADEPWTGTMPHVYDEPVSCDVWVNNGQSPTLTFGVPPGWNWLEDYFMIVLEPMAGSTPLATSSWAWGGIHEYDPLSADEPASSDDLRTPWFEETAVEEQGLYFTKTTTPGGTKPKETPRPRPYEDPPRDGGS